MGGTFTLKDKKSEDKMSAILKEKRTVFIAFLLLCSFLFSFTSCSTPPPELETVKDEYISLIEASVEVNDFIFGEGLSVYDREGTGGEKQLYLNLAGVLDNYEYVREDSKFLTIESMKIAAELVYTPEYLKSAYLMAFDGYADEVAGVSAARYLEWDNWLYKSMLYEPLIEGTRTYNYDTMKIVKPSNGEYVNVSIESELDGVKTTLTLAFSLTENGWRLDTPTY